MTNSKCSTCTKRILQHKSRITCLFCQRTFHPKCANLSPTNISHMQSLNILHSWSCYDCNIEILPISLLNSVQDKCKIADTGTYCRKREHCTTCGKIGNSIHLVSCEMCNFKSHKRCFAGLLGCKSCARDTIPGYDVSNNELFTITGKNCARFNPFKTLMVI